jgi:hypothetical protein
LNAKCGSKKGGYIPSAGHEKGVFGPIGMRKMSKKYSSKNFRKKQRKETRALWQQHRSRARRRGADHAACQQSKSVTVFFADRVSGEGLARQRCPRHRHSESALQREFLPLPRQPKRCRRSRSARTEEIFSIDSPRGEERSQNKNRARVVNERSSSGSARSVSPTRA